MCIRRIRVDLKYSLRDSETEQRALKFLHIHSSNVNSCSSDPESDRQNSPDRTIDLPFFFHYKQITLLKNLPSPTPSESLQYWFQGVVAQWCNPLTSKPEQSGGVGSKRGRASPFERHDKGSRTRLALSYFCDPIPALGAKNRNFTFTFTFKAIL